MLVRTWRTVCWESQTQSPLEPVGSFPVIQEAQGAYTHSPLPTGGQRKIDVVALKQP